MNVGHGGKYATHREQAIAALLSCRSLRAAGKACGLNHETLRRWLADPEFAEEYRQERQRVVDHVIARLQKAAEAGVATLAANAKRGETQAAAKLVEFALRGRELDELASRLDAIEAAQAEEQHLASNGTTHNRVGAASRN